MFSAQNAGRPVQRVYSTLPRLNRSLASIQRLSARLLRRHVRRRARDAFPICDRLASSAARARPKSVILTRSTPFSSRMFAGLMSRWINPCACAAARPAAACMPIRRISFTASGPRVLMRFSSETPAMNSMTRYGTGPLSSLDRVDARPRARRGRRRRRGLRGRTAAAPRRWPRAAAASTLIATMRLQPGVARLEDDPHAALADHLQHFEMVKPAQRARLNARLQERKQFFID